MLFPASISKRILHHGIGNVVESKFLTPIRRDEAIYRKVLLVSELLIQTLKSNSLIHQINSDNKRSF